ncbi:DUF5518 domain-containing protein [Saliphagus sp. GCM10025308]
MNGLLGGLVAVFASFLTFSVLLGGIVAGYLEGADQEEGIIAGLYAGFVYAALIVLPLVLGLGPVVGVGDLVGGLEFVDGGLILFMVFYSTFAGGFGGWVGAYLNAEFGDVFGRL